MNSKMLDDRLFDPALEPSADSAPVLQPVSESPHVSESEHRFRTCRWHKPADGAHPAHCTHREVLPMAGAHGFVAESWCPDCAYFKLRRVPRRNAFVSR